MRVCVNVTLLHLLNVFSKRIINLLTQERSYFQLIFPSFALSLSPARLLPFKWVNIEKKKITETLTNEEDGEKRS